MMAALIMILVVACRTHDGLEESNSTYCGVNDPATEIEWLRTELKQYESSSTHMDVYLYTALYNGNRVFYIDICCPVCGTMPPEVRDCDGNVLGRLGDGISTENFSDSKVIWRTLNGVCSRD